MSFQQCYNTTGDAKACCSRIAAAACKDGKISSGPTVTHKDGIGCEYTCSTSSSSSSVSVNWPVVGSIIGVVVGVVLLATILIVRHRRRK